MRDFEVIVKNASRRLRRRRGQALYLAHKDRRFHQFLADTVLLTRRNQG